MPGGDGVATAIIRISTNPARAKDVAVADFQQPSFQFVCHGVPPLYWCGFLVSNLISAVFFARNTSLPRYTRRSLALAPGQSGCRREASERIHCPYPDGWANRQDGKGPLPANPPLERRDDANRHQRQQKSEAGLQGQCRSRVFGPAEFTHGR